MSGVKRTIQDKDPDYEDINIVHQNKRHKAIETSARDAAVQKIESIVKEQFAVELKNKEHEIEVIDQRLNEARRMMDKLRACIVANYYASAALSKGQEAAAGCDATILNHPSIKKFLESPSRASSPANNRSETPSANNSETDSVCAQNEYSEKDGNIDGKGIAANKGAQRADAKLGKDSLTAANLNHQTSRFARAEDDNRRFVKKTIVVGNVSKYIPPDKREENDQSTHKWMVYVRGSRKEPSIDHFVKKVWFFLHPSYKPNDLVEVREPPFHLTRRGWGEFPVRVQIHFKDSQNKRIDIIHNLKLDRTYTGLQTLGAETVVEVELHRHSFIDDALCSQSSNESSLSDMGIPSPSLIKTSSPNKGAHESAEKGSPTRKHSNVSQSASGTRSPLLKVHGGSLLQSSIKQEESMFAAMPPLCPIGSHAKAQSPKTVTGGLGAFTKVIIKQEPIDPSQQQQETPSTSQPSLQQVVTVKGNHMIAVSPQKNISTPEGSKIVGIPVGSTVQAAIKPSVTISGGQILVAKTNPSASKVVGQKQMVAQGVAKAVVSGGSVTAQALGSLSKAQVSSAASAKPGSQGSVMATLQLPATNIANLANLPPGTKLYLTTNSKNPSGKGKLLLIPQGAILRAASTANLQSGMSSGSTSGTGTGSSGLPQHLTYTSYILKQTPQGTFLVGQPSSQASGKQVATNMVVQGNVASTSQGQVLKVTTGQKSSLLAQGTVGSAAQQKLSESVLKSLPVAGQTQKPGTTLLRVSGGVITAASSGLPALSGNGHGQQSSEASSSPVSNVNASSKASLQQQQAVTSASHGKLLVTSKPNTLSAAVSSSRATPSPAHTASMLTVKTEPDTTVSSSHILPFSVLNAPVKMEDTMDAGSCSVKTEHLQNFKQLLTATVKKVPLIVEKTEDGYPFCASSLEQYYTWNIGKRRAAEWQRAVTMRKMLQEIIEKQPKFSNISPLKTKQIVLWCRVHGYTPTDPENAGDESIEDVLTRIDNESALPTTYSSPEALCQKVDELEKLLKKEGDSEEEVDVLGMDEEEKPQSKKENETIDNVKLYMMPSPACEFVRDTAQEIGISLQPIEVQKNVYSSPVEEMILKATEQFVSDVLRDALAAGYQMSARNRVPREITMSNIQQAICSIPLFDFLTNRHMGALKVDDDIPLK
ncbi:YEATS domain-containing protein 2 isoform X3 [Pelobates fuscus]|uniref:YEATS domain-containing protein 2 isoform X3 n=1 Tax=Pelobates fuscus TaxID=191477 RepID=UPI002FE4D55C